MEQCERISPEECAKIMNASVQFIRIGLQQERFPFGYAVKQSETRWTYYINKKKLFEELGIEE